MPELPEVHTIVNDLKRYVINAEIVDLKLIGDYQTLADTKKLFEKTKNHKILAADRIAKNIVLELSSDHFLIIHLAMTGRLLLRKPAHSGDKFPRMVVGLAKNGKNFELRYCDMRKFGKVNLFDKEELSDFKQKYGPEPIDTALGAQDLLALLQAKKTNVKNVLLDQKSISGLGNVYANDALWMAKINPKTQTKDLTLEQAEKLLFSLREILNEGIKNRGISMSDYVDLLGEKGNQQNFFRIYQKETCPGCQSRVEFMQLNNRGTYFCPVCQPR